MPRLSVVPRPLVPTLLLLILPGLSSRAVAAGFDETHRLWTVHGASPGASFGAAVAPAGDVNGDGFLDVIVGAPNSVGTAGPSAGKAFVYYGSAGGLASTPGWEAEGEGEDSRFGFAVASAGDVNGDGFDDVIVGAPYLDVVDLGSDVGRIYVYLGSAQGLSTTASFTAVGVGNDLGHVGGLGYAVSSGDFDGDGFSDVVASEVGRYGGQVVVFYGSPSGPSPDRFWRSVGGHFSGRVAATDLNQDGYDDLFISAYAFQLDLFPHAASVHLGAPGGLPPAETPPAVTFPEAYATTPLGDVDHDGRVDVLTVEYRTSLQDAFAAHVLHRGGSRIGSGQKLGPVLDVASLVFGAGDLNGDGFADAIALDGPIFYLYFGSSSGFRPLSDGIGPAPGSTLAALPDVNGDGFSDLLVGNSANERVDLYRGGTDWGFSASADVAVQKSLCIDCVGVPVELTVGNAGPDPVRVRLVDLVPPSLSDFAWFCVPLPGAASTGCPTLLELELQPGDIDVVITLLPGSSIDYRALAGTALLPVVNTASLSLPSWATDPNASDNHAVAVHAPPPMEMIFADRFDSGDLSAWSSHSASGVEVVPAPAHQADYVLQATASPSAPAVVRDETPADEPDYHARFLLDPDAFGQHPRPHAARGRDHRAVVFSGRSDGSSPAVFDVVLEATQDAVFLIGRARLDDSTVRETAPVPFTRAPHLVEIAWHRSSGPVANDGQFQLRVDGAGAAGFSDLDTDSVGGIDAVALGLDVGGRRLPARIGRSVFLDGFESWRLTSPR